MIVLMGVWMGVIMILLMIVNKLLILAVRVASAAAVLTHNRLSL